MEEVADPGKAFDAAMALAAKVAAQPPLSVAMTKLTVNRLAHALDDLASHMDVDQFALASMQRRPQGGVEAFLVASEAAVRGGGSCGGYSCQINLALTRIAVAISSISGLVLAPARDARHRHIAL